MSEHNDAADSNQDFDEPFPSMGIMQPDETPVWPLSRLILAGVIITIILQVWLGALYYQYNSRETANKNNAVTDMLGASKTVVMVNGEAQQALTASARVADAKTGRIAIPIALAQKQVIAELTKNPEADVTGPAPAATAETAPAAEEAAKPEEKPSKEEMESKEEKPAAAEEKASEEEAAEEKPAKEEMESKEEKPAAAEEKASEEKAAEEKPAKEEAAEEKPAEEQAEGSEESTATEEEASAEPEAAKDE